MTTIGITSSPGWRTQHRRLRQDGAQQSTPMEARLLTLRPGGLSVIARPALHEEAQLWLATRGRSVRTYGRVAWWLVALAVFGFAWYVIDQGGHASPFRSEVSSPSASGSGRVPLALTPGDVVVRVSVSTAAGPWFWCLESSLGLPPERHLCRNSGATDSASAAVLSDGVVHFDAAAMRGARFFVQMYCRDGCSWRADATKLSGSQQRE